MKLSQLRPHKGVLPIISQLRALQDLKSMTVAQVARDYRVDRGSLWNWKRRGINTRIGIPLPPGFELLGTMHA